MTTTEQPKSDSATLYLNMNTIGELSFSDIFSTIEAHFGNCTLDQFTLEYRTIHARSWGSTGGSLEEHDLYLVIRKVVDEEKDPYVKPYTLQHMTDTPAQHS